jgi:hypothetical protein
MLSMTDSSQQRIRRVTVLDLKLSNGVKSRLYYVHDDRSILRTLNLTSPDALNLQMPYPEAIIPVFKHWS